MEIDNKSKWYRRCNECNGEVNVKDIKIGKCGDHSIYSTIALCDTCRENLCNLLFQEKIVEEDAIKKKQIKIIKHYGGEHQLDILIEELAEAIQAISKYKRNSYSESTIKYVDLMIEELADVKNLIEQLELSNEYIKKWIEKDIECKVDRQLKRIEEEE